LQISKKMWRWKSRLKRKRKQTQRPMLTPIWLAKLKSLHQVKVIRALSVSTCSRLSQHVHGTGRETAKEVQRRKSKQTEMVVLHD
jgi:hypothetical protein